MVPAPGEQGRQTNIINTWGSQLMCFDLNKSFKSMLNETICCLVLFAILFDAFKLFVYDFHSKDTCLQAKWSWHSISYHAVMHDLIPVFTCDYSKEYSDGFPRSGEVCVPVGERGKGNSSCRVISTHAVSFT